MSRKKEGISIELRNIKIYERMSEETTAFVADIYIDGVKVGLAKNDGRGGSTDYHAYPEHRELLKEAEQLCLSLPPKKYDSPHGMDTFELSMNLENFIDNLVYEELKNKDKKKFEKKMLNHIMWGVPKSGSYYQIKFKIPLTQINKLQLQSYVDKYKKELKEGEVILNTNLQQLGISI